MLPVNDFNFVVAGIATFAATVGYACTRRLSSALKPESSSFLQPLDGQPNGNEGFHPAMKAPVVAESSVPFTSDTGYITSTNVIPSLSNKDGLKRKVPHDGFEEPEKPVKTELGYPHNLTQIYPPNKRIKTPPLTEDVNTPPTPIPVPELDSLKTRVMDEDLELPVATENFDPIVATPASEPPFSPSPAPDSPCPTPGVVIPSPAISPDPQPTNPQPLARELITQKPFASSSGGFAAFAGSTSPFSAVAGKSQHSAVTSGRPVWSSSASDLTTYQSKSDEGVLDNTFKSVSPFNMGNVLEEGKIDTSLPTAKHTHLTGEEDEDIEMELKGAKLYVKRGEKSFGEGIPGHIKLLSHRTTSEERILFRREPLWKVSMNVRLQPTVRCAFVPEENALKLILKETVDAPSADSSTEPDLKQELVIYVLKPGRSCSKKDFKEFAETLAKSPQFRSVALTCSSAAP